MTCLKLRWCSKAILVASNRYGRDSSQHFVDIVRRVECVEDLSFLKPQDVATSTPNIHKCTHTTHKTATRAPENNAVHAVEWQRP